MYLYIYIFVCIYTYLFIPLIIRKKINITKNPHLPHKQKHIFLESTPLPELLPPCPSYALGTQAEPASLGFGCSCYCLIEHLRKLFCGGFSFDLFIPGEGRQVASLFLSFTPSSHPLLFSRERDTQLFLVIRVVFAHL